MRSLLSKFKAIAMPLALVFLINSCGGVSKEAKVATFIQVLMVTFLESNITSFAAGTTTSEFQCPESGSYTLSSGTLGGIDPSNPSATAVISPVIFNECRIKVCGDFFTVKGEGSTVTIQGVSGSATAEMQVTFDATDLFIAGPIGGKFKMAYKLRAKTSADSLGSIVIEDVEPAKPLQAEGATYPASDLKNRADGC